MAMTDLTALVDRIYEAAVLPELWPDVCAALSDIVDAYCASVITIDQHENIRWVTTANIEAEMEAFSKSDLRFQNIRPQRALELSPFSFARDVDVMTEAEIAADPVYNALLRPKGLGWTIGSAIAEPSGHRLVFDFIRRADLGAFTPDHVALLNVLRPDLARGALISSRLVFEQARSMATTLALIGLPAAVLGDRGRVLAMNDDMEALSPRIRIGAGNRLSLQHLPAGDLLEAALRGLALKAAPGVQSIPLPAGEEWPALILHLLPIRRNARDVFSRSLAVMIVSPVGLAGAPDLRVLSGLFDLTPGEARVARHLAGGATTEATAATMNLSIETVRSYLKRIFLKTGTRRQSELVRLLSGLGRIAS